MGDVELTRRSMIVAPVLLAAIAGCGNAGNADIGPLGIACGSSLMVASVTTSGRSMRPSEHHGR